MNKKPLLVLCSMLLLTSCAGLGTNSSDVGQTSSGNQEEQTSSVGEVSSATNSSVADISSTPDYNLEGFKLKWQDEFDGNELNLDYWTPMIGDGCSYGICGWGNNELQYYTDENHILEDGVLTIQARKENKGGKSYTSARLRTAEKVNMLYGRLEARMSLPLGTGLWPAFWMLPDTNSYGGWPTSGEIDIMEARGRIDDMTSAALHFDQGFGTGQKYETRSAIIREGTINDYHVYALEWEKEEMRWYVDDDCFMTLRYNQWNCSVAQSNPYAPFDKEFHILFNFAIGGNFDGGQKPDNDFESADLKIDYVRMYDFAE